MPTLGKNVEYAIHSLVYLIDNPKDIKITVKDLANFQNISETYLAKAFTKMKKAGIVKSNIGVKGGYKLARSSTEITFLDIVLAVEGEISFFECHKIRDNCVLLHKSELPWKENSYCAIHLVMIEAENKIKDTLKEKNLQWVYDTIRKQYGQEMIDKTQNWFQINVFDSK